jgi:hypothetical protein
MSKKSINWFVFTVICLSSKQIVHTTNKQNKRLNIEYDTTEKIPAKKDKNNNNNLFMFLTVSSDQISLVSGVDLTVNIPSIILSN